MIDKRVERETEQQILELEKIFEVKLQLLEKMTKKIQKFRKSQKNTIKAAKAYNELQTKIKKLEAEKELLKYSAETKCGYLHNLSATLGLIAEFEELFETLKKKDKYRRKQEISGEPIRSVVQQVRYSEKKLEYIAKIAEETGDYKAVASHLEISEEELNTQRKQSSQLEFLLKESMLRYASKNRLSVSYKFTDQEKVEIIEIVKKEGVDAVARKYKVSYELFSQLRRKNKDLAKIISSGLEQSKKITSYESAIQLFKGFTKEQLSQITELAKLRGLGGVGQKYGYSSYIINKCRQEILDLDKAITKGLNAKQTESLQYKKPERELVADLRSIENIGEENALARYRRMKEAEKETMSRKKLKNMKDFV